MAEKMDGYVKLLPSPAGRAQVNHGLLVLDDVRNDPMRAAIKEVVKPGDTVVDIGTGTGILAFFAVQAGARKVYAIESQDTVYVARYLAYLNHFEDKISFLKGISYEVTLPERVDVLIGENIGHYGVEENILDIFQDARERFLKPGGLMLPQRLKLYLAPAEMRHFGEIEMEVWKKKRYDLDFSFFSRAAPNAVYVASIEPDRLMGEAQALCEIDLNRDTPRNEVRVMDFKVSRPGLLNGLVGFFEVELSPNVKISTSPKAKRTHWQQVFFPMLRGVEAGEGYNVTAKFRAQSARTIMVFFWRIIVTDPAGAVVYNELHSNWPGFGIAADVVPNTIAPTIPINDQILCAILFAMDGFCTVDIAATDLCLRFPQIFPNKQATAVAIAQALARPDVQASIRDGTTRAGSLEQAIQHAQLLAQQLAKGDPIDQLMPVPLPAISQDRRAWAFILSNSNGRHTYLAIATALAQRMPDVFPTVDHALPMVKKVVEDGLVNLFQLR
jgi:protein arginine N-methyltransferase 1